MRSSPGTFLVLEGSDGSGKATQLKLLSERLQAVGYDVEVFDFPQYDQPSSHFVKRYLAGDYGSASKVSPYTASLFFALDRFEAAPAIKKALSEGKIALSNRFVGANMAHQGSKFINPVEQRAFFVWEDSLEYQLLGIPRPKINLFLRVPADVTVRLINERAKKTGVALDEHEKDTKHLSEALKTYDTLCKLFPRDYKAIDCAEGGRLLPIADINNRIWSQIQSLLPPRPEGKGGQRTVRLEPGASTTPAKAASPKPAQANISTPESIEALVSLELALPIVQAVPSAHIEDWDGKSFVRDFQTKADGDLNKKYQQFMVEAGERYKKISSKLRNKHMAMALAPLAAKVRISFNPTPLEAQKLIDALAAVGTPEAKNLAQTIEKTHPRANMAGGSSTPADINTVLKEIASRLQDGNLPPEGDAVSLVEAYPKNEFHLLADIVYPVSDLPKRHVERNLERWGYQQKFDALRAAVVAKDEKILGQVRYVFDALLSSHQIVRLIGMGVISDVVTQPVSPRLGYKVPAVLESLGLSDDYEHCFDKSLEFYTLAETNEQVAKATVLYGNKRRCQFSITAAGLARLSDSSQSKLASELVQAAADVHPVIVDALSAKSTSGRKKSTTRKRH